MSSVNWPLYVRGCRQHYIRPQRAELRGVSVHDECAFLFLVIFVRKERVVVNSITTRKLLVYIGDLLLELTQALPMSLDVISDILLQTLYSGYAALEEGMQDYFL
jgi:hypothetical protein